MLRLFEICCYLSVFHIEGIFGFTHFAPGTTHHHQSRTSFRTNCDEVTRCYAKGFGGAGFGASDSSTSKSKKKVKKSEAKKIQTKILKKYGGDIARGTQRRIEDAMKNLPPHLQMATQLYQQLKRWDAHVSTLSVLQQANLSPQELDGPRRAQEELARLYEEHKFTEQDLHNIFQKITWDASADAKAARSITGDMPEEVSNRVDRACQIASEAVKKGGDDGAGNDVLNSKKNKKNKKDGCKVLDVGCGFGVLVPHLTKFGIAASQIYGVDLSSEMIRNAREQHRGVQFDTVDFLNDFPSPEEDGLLFDSVMFCSSLHDMPDPMTCLQKAATLIRPEGKIIVVHPQGATHVLNQVKSNPVMVKRGLPDAEELRILCHAEGLQLEMEPAQPGSAQESKDGYLAVLTKNKQPISV